MSDEQKEMQDYKPSLIERAWNSGKWPSVEGRRLADIRLAEMKAEMKAEEETNDGK